MKSLFYYNALSAEHLSSPGAVVNNASPRREGPANEVDGVPLHCVTHEAGWLAGRPAGRPQHGGAPLAPVLPLRLVAHTAATYRSIRE